MTTRNLAHLATRLYGVPLMLLPSAADAISNTFQTLLEHRGGLIEADGQIVAPPRPQGFASNIRAARYADKPYLVTDQGVGVLGIYGVLLQRYAFDAASCTSFASYQVIRQYADAMFADPDVKAVLQEFDTPGGEAAGVHEATLAIAAAAKASGKPLWAHVNEDAFSAGYYLASSAGRIAVPQAGRVGSIGVVMAHVDQSQRDAKQGLTWTFVYAGKHKVEGNSHAPLSEQAKKRMGAEVSRLYDLFVGQVAQARLLDAQVVRDTEAEVLAAGDAKTIGLVDAVASFDDTLAELTDYVHSKSTTGSSPTVGGRHAAATSKGATMSHTPSAANEAATPPQSGSSGITEAQAAEREAAAHASGVTEGRAQELARAKGVREAALPGHEALVEQMAADGKTTPAEAAMAVLKAEREATKGAAAAHFKDAPAAVPSTHAPDASSTPKGAELGKSMVALFNQFNGRTSAAKGA